MGDIEVKNYWGSVLAEATDKAHHNHRWWFETTEAGRLVLISEVIHFDADGDSVVDDLLTGRHYVDESKADVPDRVREVLEGEGFDCIVDPDGHVI